MPDTLKIPVLGSLLIFLFVFYSGEIIAQAAKQASDQIQNDDIEGAIWCTRIGDDIEPQETRLLNDQILSIRTKSGFHLLDAKTGAALPEEALKTGCGKPRCEGSRSAVTSDGTYLYQAKTILPRSGIPQFEYEVYRTRLDDFSVCDTFAFTSGSNAQFAYMQYALASRQQAGKVLLSFNQVTKSPGHVGLITTYQGYSLMLDTDGPSPVGENRTGIISLGYQSKVFISPDGKFGISNGYSNYTGHKVPPNKTSHNQLFRTDQSTPIDPENPSLIAIELPELEFAKFAPDSYSFLLFTETGLSYRYIQDQASGTWKQDAALVIESTGTLLRHGKFYLQADNANSQLQIIDLDGGEFIAQCPLIITDVKNIILSTDQTLLYLISGSGTIAAVDVCSELLTVTDIKQDFAQTSISAAAGFRLAPNPVNALLLVTHPEVSSGLIKVMDLTGREILSLPINNQHNSQIDVSQLSPGVYGVEVVNKQTRAGDTPTRSQQLFVKQ